MVLDLIQEEVSHMQVGGKGGGGGSTKMLSLELI